MGGRGKEGEGKESWKGEERKGEGRGGEGRECEREMVSVTLPSPTHSLLSQLPEMFSGTRPSTVVLEPAVRAGLEALKVHVGT